MKTLFIYLNLLLTTILIAQNKYEPGYYIDNKGNKIECNIRNDKNIYFHKEFHIKDNDSNIKTIFFNNIQEVSFNNKKFLNTYILNDINKITNPNIKLKYEKKLINVIIEDENVSLYKYEDENKKIFLYKNQNDTIRELIFKTIEIENNKIENYNFFRQQLFNISDKKSIKDFENVKYTLNELIKIVSKINKKDFKNLQIVKKDSIEINFKAGVYQYTQEHNLYVSGNIDQNVNFGKTRLNGLNFDFEITPPFLKRRFSLVYEMLFDINKYSGTANVVKPYFINPNYYLEYSTKSTFRNYIGIKLNFKLYNKFSLYILPKISTFDKYKGNIYVERDINNANFKLNQRSSGISLGLKYKNLIFDISYIKNNIKSSNDLIFFNLKYQFLKSYFKYNSYN